MSLFLQPFMGAHILRIPFHHTENMTKGRYLSQGTILERVLNVRPMVMPYRTGKLAFHSSPCIPVTCYSIFAFKTHLIFGPFSVSGLSLDVRYYIKETNTGTPSVQHSLEILKSFITHFAQYQPIELLQIWHVPSSSSSLSVIVRKV